MASLSANTNQARWGAFCEGDIDAELDNRDDEESDPGEDNGDGEPDVDDEDGGEDL